ncbi:MAG: hypothetical protein H5T95_09740 [Firmicutes bacterium]|nr:hypothetical protein [Bacillota bacterium]
MTERLRERARQKAQTIPGFLGYDLHRLAERERKTIDELLRELKPEGDATLLLLCRTPRKEHFLGDVKSISDYVRIAPESLLSLLRRLEVLDLFSSPLPSTAKDALLLAALESDVDDDPEGENHDD